MEVRRWADFPEGWCGDSGTWCENPSCLPLLETVLSWGLSPLWTCRSPSQLLSPSCPVGDRVGLSANPQEVRASRDWTVSIIWSLMDPWCDQDTVLCWWAEVHHSPTPGTRNGTHAPLPNTGLPQGRGRAPEWNLLPLERRKGQRLLSAGPLKGPLLWFSGNYLWQKPELQNFFLEMFSSTDGILGEKGVSW